MGSMRVYELANELGIESKETLSRCRELNIPVKSHMSIIEEADIKKLKEYLSEREIEAEAGKIEEKRVRKNVIRRRAVRPVEEPPAAEEEPEEIEEKVAAKKKVKARAGAEAAAPAKAVKKAAAKEEKAGPVKALKKAPRGKEPPARAAKSAPAADSGPAREDKAVEEKPVKARVYPLRPYSKPSIRRTARAVDEVPSKAAEKGAEAEKAPGAEVKKKKKKGKVQEQFEEKELPAKKKGKVAPPPAKKKSLRRKITFKSQQGAILDGMELMDMERMYIPARKKPVGKKRAPKKTKVTVPKQIKRQVKMAEKITVLDLARRMGVKAAEVVEKISGQGMEAGLNTALDYEVAALVAHEFNYEVIQEVFEEAKILAFPTREEMPEKLAGRPPVVTLMGHVDHGKTSLLDYIRKSRVAEQEAGGITQHIGASMIDTPSGRVTFLDTPGHEAFTAMRARGARVTDIVVLVVAADDGIMPQTREAANHSRAAGVPIIVAINKIDLPGARADDIKGRLTELNLLPEEYGGETLVVTCSAKTGEGVDELLESILLQAELLELKANPDRLAEGVVIESRLDKGKGAVCSVVIQQGTLRAGKPVICGNFSGKVRAMINDKGQNVKEAGPSHPVEIVGLSGVPMPGDRLLEVEDDRKARMVSEHRKEQHRQSTLTAPVKASLEDLLAMAQAGQKPKLGLILKADTNGSIEAVKEVLNKVFADRVDLEIIQTGVGGITENDVLLASASGATIVGFMVRPESKAQKLAEREKIELRLYQIIYNLADDMEARLKGLFKPEIRERVIGHAEVREIFRVPRVGTVAGSYVSDGLINRTAKARLLREQVVIHEGRIGSLKRFKDDAREVAAGFECGITIENYQDIKPGDVIEAFVLEEVREG